MSFETHLTLETTSQDALDRARQWAHFHNLKWTHIELQSGHTPSQPMLTFWGVDSLDSQLRRAKAIQHELQQLQIKVVRIKIETDFLSEFAPPLGCAEPQHSDQYFECHVKLRLKSVDDLDRLRAIAAPHMAHVSRNVLKTYIDGATDRFVTLRSHHCTSDHAAQNQLELISSLRQHRFEIIEIESELVLYDSNFALDAGWN